MGRTGIHRLSVQLLMVNPSTRAGALPEGGKYHHAAIGNGKFIAASCEDGIEHEGLAPPPCLASEYLEAPYAAAPTGEWRGQVERSLEQFHRMQIADWDRTAPWYVRSSRRDKGNPPPPVG